MEERKHETASEEGTDEHSDESGLSKMFLRMQNYSPFCEQLFCILYPFTQTR